MTRPPMDERYSGVAIALHWIIALGVLTNFAVVLIPGFPVGMPGHKAIGITVLFLTLARVVWRIGHRAPPLPAGTPGWEKGLAHATHGLLYLLLIAMPLTGWMMASRPEKRRPLEWFGTFDIPYLPVSTPTGQFGHDAHGPIGWLMLALVVLHIAAALRHHFLLRDTVLARMIPALRR